MEISSLKAMRNLKASVPLWRSGASLIFAVSGVGAAGTAAVGALVSVSSLPASSVKLNLTLMALPWSAETSVYQSFRAVRDLGNATSDCLPAPLSGFRRSKCGQSTLPVRYYIQSLHILARHHGYTTVALSADDRTRAETLVDRDSIV